MPRKESTASAQLRATINNLDAEANGAKTAHEVFDLVDRDGDGSIDRNEFEKVYYQLQDHVREEHKKEKEAEMKISKATRRVKLMGTMLVVLLMVLAISIAGVAALALGGPRRVSSTRTTSRSVCSGSSGSGSPRRRASRLPARSKRTSEAFYSFYNTRGDERSADELAAAREKPAYRENRERDTHTQGGRRTRM